jgi:hypothetical protein
MDESGLSAFDHFMTIGWQQDYNPNSWFDLKKYRIYLTGSIANDE